jgi:hypothetical protein
MFSGPDSRTAIAWRRIGIPWTRMSPSSTESFDWDLAFADRDYRYLPDAFAGTLF